jgi:FkbM family methyltransferase
MERLTHSARRFAARSADRVADALARRLAERLAVPQTGPAPVEREGLDNRTIELLLGFFLNEDSNCIDIGANQGRFLSHMLARAPAGRHLAWEPVPSLAAHLRDAFPAVDVHEAALSDENGESEFLIVPEDLAYSGLRERAYPGDYHPRPIRVRVERLDDALPANFDPALIKIDVEGAELSVLRGGLATITRARPVVVFESGLGASDRYGTTPDAVHDLICGTAGLRLFDLDATGPLSRDQFAEIYAAGSRWNFVALP